MKRNSYEGLFGSVYEDEKNRLNTISFPFGAFMV